MLKMKPDQLEEEISSSALINLLHHIEDGVCLFDSEQRLLACNKKYIEMYKLPAEMAKPGITLMEILLKRVSQNSGADMPAEAYIANRMKAVHDAVDRTDIHHMPDGKVLSVRHKPLEGGGWLTTHTDISEIYDLKREVEYLAYHDQLTGVANRRSLEISIAQQINGCKKGRYVGLMFIDLDGFKPINDQFGHEAGDNVLINVAQRLKKANKDLGKVGRMGGDEFVVLHSDISNIAEYASMAKNLVDQVCEPMSLGKEKVSVGVSIGAICTDDPKTKVKKLWNQADHAMYEAKRNGGRQYTLAGYEQ